MGQGAGSETHKRRARQHEIQRMQGRAADVVVRRDTYDTAASLAIAALGGPKLCTYVHTYVRNVHTQLHMYVHTCAKLWCNCKTWETQVFTLWGGSACHTLTGHSRIDHIEDLHRKTGIAAN